MDSFLSLKYALAVFLPGQSGLIFRFVCVLPVFWIAFLPLRFRTVSARRFWKDNVCHIFFVRKWCLVLPAQDAIDV